MTSSIPSITIQTTSKLPAANTAAASGLLKVLLAATYTGTPVKFALPDPEAAKSKVVFRVGFENGLELIEPNAITR